MSQSTDVPPLDEENLELFEQPAAKRADGPVSTSNHSDDSIEDIDQNDFTDDILTAASNGDNTTFWNLINKDESLIDAVDNNGNTVLHNACYYSEAADLVKQITDKYPHLMHKTNNDGEKPIHYAAKNGYADVFWYFIEKDESLIDAVDEEGNTVLHKACYYSEAADFAKQIADKYPRLVHKTNNYGRKPIHYAAIYGNADVFWYFIKKDDSLIDAVEEDDNTVLHKACYYSEADDLVKQIANTYPHLLHKANNVDHKPIHVAVQRGNLNIVKMLLEKIKTDKQVDYESSCLWYQDKLKNVLLHYAVEQDDVDLLVFVCSEMKDSYDKKEKKYKHYFNLTENSCYLDIENAAGNTPLHCAMEGYNNLDIVKYLIDQNADLEHKNKSGETPFLLACKCCRLKIIKYLVEDNKVNFNVTDNLGNCGLHLAALSDSYYMPECVRYLRELNLSFTNENNEKLNVALYSIRNNNTEFLSEFINDLLNCNGLQTSQNMNIYHVLAMTKVDSYMSQDIIELLKNFPDKIQSEYLKTKILDGDLKGCLPIHIAFRSSSGIKTASKLWKIEQQQIYEETIEKENCIDIACNNIPLLELRNALKILTHSDNNDEVMNWPEILRLIDNVRHTFPYQSKQNAQAFLMPFCDSNLKSEISNNLDIPKHTKIENNKRIQVFTKFTRVLQLVLSTKSAKLFKNFIFCFQYKNTRSVVSDLIECWQQKIKEKNKKSNQEKQTLTHLEITYKKSLSFVEIVLNESMDDDNFDLAKDVLLCENFNLLPSALRVMIWVNQFDNKTDALIDLHNFATNVVINTLSCLHKTTANDKKNLSIFHNYFNGKFLFNNEFKESTFSLYSTVKINKNANKPNKKCSISQWIKKLTKHVDQQSENEDQESKNEDQESENEDQINENEETDCKILDRKYSVFELIQLTENKELLATECMIKFVDQKWSPTIIFKFYAHFVMFIIMMSLLSYYQIILTNKFHWLDVVIAMFWFSYLLQEIIELVTSKSPINYFTNTWNWFDIFGLIFLAIAVFWKMFIVMQHTLLAEFSVYQLQCLLATSFLCFSLRFLAFLRYWQDVGLYIGTFFKLLRSDFLPFFAVLVTFIVGFGMFAFTILTPGAKFFNMKENSYDLNLLLSIYTRPLNLLFGELDSEKLKDCQNKTNTEQEQDCYNPVGAKIYYNCLLCMFMLLVNVPLMNLLIAKFSMTVADEKEVAKILARQYLLDMQTDFNEKTYLPPPFNMFEYLKILLDKIYLKITKKKSNSQTETDPKSGSQTETDPNLLEDEHYKTYPQKYKDFLWMQALALRKKRAELTVDVKENGSAQEKLETQLRNTKRELLNDSNACLTVLETEMSQMQTGMSHLQTEMSQKQTKLQTDMSQMQTDMSQMQTGMSHMQTKLETNMSQMQTNMSQMQTNLQKIDGMLEMLLKQNQ